MALRITETLIDDITGDTADETISFGLDGTSYEIDLTEVNAKQLREALAPFVKAGRRAGTTHAVKSAKRRRAPRATQSRDIREWAKAHGIEVSKRGRIDAATIARYEAAQRGS